MYIVFTSPPMTGKTTNADKLRHNLRCDFVIESEALRSASVEACDRAHRNRRVLVLVSDGDTVDTKGHTTITLSQDECNKAMIEVGGHRIWNTDGSRYKVKV